MIRLEAIFFLIKNGEKYLSSFQIYFYDSSFPISHYHLTSRYECAIKETNQINFKTTWFISLLTKTFYFLRGLYWSNTNRQIKSKQWVIYFMLTSKSERKQYKDVTRGYPWVRVALDKNKSFPLSRNLWLKILFLCGVTKYNIVSILMALNKKVR